MTSCTAVCYGVLMVFREFDEGEMEVISAVARFWSADSGRECGLDEVMVVAVAIASGQVTMDIGMAQVDGSDLVEEMVVELTLAGVTRCLTFRRLGLSTDGWLPLPGQPQFN